MDQRTAIQTVNKYLDYLKKQKYKIKKAYIFGSYAKNDYNEDSDIDIAIVMENIDDHFDTQINLMKLRRKFDNRIEPHPFEVDEFNESHPFAFEILKTGIEV
ncbi:hypothetical protein ES703_86398 [subsurface metagenome]